MAALFAHAPAAYDALRIIGGVYLLWLAISHFRGDPQAGLDDSPDGGGRSPRRVFLRAWLNNLANPKVILFYLAFLPQFVTPAAGSVTVQLLILGVVFLLLGLIIDLALGVFSGRIGNWLRQRVVVRKLLDRVAGTIMAGLGVRRLGVRLLVSARHA